MHTTTFVQAKGPSLLPEYPSEEDSPRFNLQEPYPVGGLEQVPSDLKGDDTGADGMMAWIWVWRCPSPRKRNTKQLRSLLKCPTTPLSSIPSSQPSTVLRTVSCNCDNPTSSLGFLSWILGFLSWILGFLSWILGFLSWILGFLYPVLFMFDFGPSQTTLSNSVRVSILQLVVSIPFP